MRSIVAATQTVLAALTQDHVIGLIYLPDIPLRLTTWPQDVTWNGETWVSPIANGELSGVDVRGISENTDGAVPGAELSLSCVDGTQQARFWSDVFRDRLAYVTAILDTSIGASDGIVYPETPWQMDADSDGRSTVTVRMSMTKSGQQIPHRTTQESHCEHEYGPTSRARSAVSLCPYRGNLATCDFTLEGPNGCAAHFGDIDANGDPWVEGTSTGERFVIPLPFGGAASGMADRLVR